ncbi:MAG: class I SAM-dependent methyltransferase, partial [Jiangellaceae bacterium]
MSESGSVEIDWSDLADRLGASAGDDSAWYDVFARELARPTDRLAVDVGCGGGGMISALLEALPAEASVIGVDGNADVLAVARQRIDAAVEAVDAGRVQLVQLDLEADLSAVAVPATADIVWASAVVHHLGDQQRAIETLVGLLAPGGRLALAEGGLGTRHLPWDVGIGEPGLEGRLVAADDQW